MYLPLNTITVTYKIYYLILTYNFKQTCQDNKKSVEEAKKYKSMFEKNIIKLDFYKEKVDTLAVSIHLHEMYVPTTLEFLT